jgi:hypothetical protein
MPLPRSPHFIGEDGADSPEDRQGDGGEEVGEGLGACAEVRQAGEVGGEARVLQLRGGGGSDRFAVVHEVGAVVGAALEAEAVRALRQGQGCGGEVGEVGYFEGEAGGAFAEAVDGPEWRAVAVEARDAPGAGEVAAGDRRLGVALEKGFEEAVAEGVLVERVGGGAVTLLVRSSQWVLSFASAQGMAVAATAVMPAFWFVRGSRSASLSARAGLGESLLTAGEVLPCRGLQSRSLLSIDDDLRYINA